MFLFISFKYQKKNIFTAFQNLFAWFDNVGHDDIVPSILGAEKPGQFSAQLSETSCDEDARGFLLLEGGQRSFSRRRQRTPQN